MVMAATIRPPPPPRDVSIDKTYRLLARLVHSGSSFGLGLRWYWKMSSDHPAFSFSGDCRRRQWCSLKQGQRFSLSKKTLAEVPQAVVVRPLIQLQLHAALGQFKSCLWIQGGNLPHRLIQRFQQKHPVGKYCLDFLSPTIVSAPIAHCRCNLLDR